MRKKIPTRFCKYGQHSGGLEVRKKQLALEKVVVVEAGIKGNSKLQRAVVEEIVNADGKSAGVSKEDKHAPGTPESGSEVDEVVEGLHVSQVEYLQLLLEALFRDGATAVAGGREGRNRLWTAMSCDCW